MRGRRRGSAWALAEGEGLRGLPWTVAIVPETEADGFNLRRGEGGTKLLEQELCGLGRDFILDDDVGLEALTILRDEMVGEVRGQPLVEGKQRLALQGIGDTLSKRSKTCHRDRECLF